MKIFPFDDVVKEAVAKMYDGATVHQQFLCANCGVKQTMDTPDQFFIAGICEECGHMTDIQRDGCNYLAILGNVS